MLEIKGEYNAAKIYTETLEDSAAEQIKTLCDQEFSRNSRIRIMPDVHAGAGCTIGTTMTIADNKIVPNLVGVDIGCGMETLKFKSKRFELQRLDKLIYENIPSGMEIRRIPHRYNEQIDLSLLKCRNEVNLDRAHKSIGTLGGGNHFIEVDTDENGDLYLVIHTGSRHLGLQVANYYQQQGWNSLNRSSSGDIQRIIDEYKATGSQELIQTEINRIKSQILTDIPKNLAYVTGDLFDDYIHDMQIVQQFAVLNRKAIADEIIKGMKLDIAEEFTTIHNYIDTESMILRKGAVSAKLGERLLIPINMRDGSLICTGKGNEEWNYSAPHGAGRLFSRTEAKNSFTVSQFKREMKGIYTTSISSETLDECPMAYKSMDEIIKNIEPTAQIESVIKPIYNFKAGE